MSVSWWIVLLNIKIIHQSQGFLRKINDSSYTQAKMLQLNVENINFNFIRIE